MNLLALEPLFDIGGFEINTVNLSILILLVILVLAFVFYRYNHRKQAKAANLMDSECRIYNEKGLEKFLKLKGKKFSNPTIVVVHIRNLNYLYINYHNHESLMYEIANSLLVGLDKIEVIARIEFDKFIIVYDNKSKDQVKENCVSI